MEQQLVVFELGEDFYGIDVAHVESIIKLPKITPVPLSVAHLEGVMNLRGEVVPVIDLRTRMGMAKVESTMASRIIVVVQDEKQVGMIVDAVTEVITITLEEVQETAVLGGSTLAGLLTGIAKFEERLIICLNPALILQADLQAAVAMVEV